MLGLPGLDVVEQPDPPGLQHRDRDGEVRTPGKTVDLLPGHPQQHGQLGDASEPEGVIHPRRLETLWPLPHEMGNVRHLLPDGETGEQNNMPTSSTISGASTTTNAPGQARREVVELHWMNEPDIAMYDDCGVAVPALCGAWMEPDEPLAEQLTAGVALVDYVSCRKCDVLHAFDYPA